MINLKKAIGLGLIILTIGATSATVFAFPMHKSPIKSVTENFIETSSGITTVEDGIIYSNNQNNCHGGLESEMHDGMNYNSNSKNNEYRNNSSNINGNSHRRMSL